MINGCTFIGFAAGTLIDNESIHSVAISKIDSVKHGKWLEISLDDSTEVAGHFEGTDGMYRSQYRASYAQASRRLSPELQLPVFGSEVIVVDTAGNSQRVDFLGFDLGRMMEPSIVIKKRSDVNFRTVFLSSFKSLEGSAGTPFDIAGIDSQIRNDSIPVASKGILIENRTGMVRVAVSDVVKMKTDDHPKEERIAWLPGLVFGLAMDVVSYYYIATLLAKGGS